MPELPEVRTVIKYLNQDIQNEVITDCDFLVVKMVKNDTPKSFKKKLINQEILKVANFGKFILFKISNGCTLLTHLRMEGKYRFESELHLTKHDHAWFKFKNGFLIYNDVRKFGTFEIKKNKELLTTEPLKKLGKLPSEINENKLHEKLSKKRISIKSALLDQTIILGLGNIYVDEVLFASNILPTRAANSLTQKEVNKVIRKAKFIMQKATKEGGSSIRTYLAYGNKRGNYQNYLKVHTKNDEECYQCKSKILKTKVNGRGTYYCNKCQK